LLPIKIANVGAQIRQRAKVERQRKDVKLSIMMVGTTTAAGTLRANRISLGLSQSRLALLSGVSRFPVFDPFCGAGTTPFGKRTGRMDRHRCFGPPCAGLVRSLKTNALPPTHLPQRKDVKPSTLMAGSTIAAGTLRANRISLGLSQSARR
jgi:hypothetical protein